MTNKKKNKKVLIISITAIFVIALGVGVLFLSKNKNVETEKTKITNTPKSSLYRIEGNSVEPFDFYFLQLENNEENKIYSPLSIKYALEMLAEGTKENSKVQIDNIIGDYKAKKYVNDQHMSFANAMFIKTAYKDAIKSEYTKNLSDRYGAEILYDTFETPDNLNQWVSNKTFKLISNLFDDVADKDFVLVNALAIDMEWKKLIQATSDHYEDVYNVNYLHENFNMHIEPLDTERFETIKFNNKNDVKSLEIGAAINNYDIVNVLGEDNIRRTVSQEYTKWLAEGGCGNPDNPDVETYLDSYIKQLNSNYKKIDSSTDFSLYDDEEVKVFAKDLKEYNGITLQYVGIMPKQTSLNNYINDINSKKVNNIINNLKELNLENFKDGVVTKIVGKIPLFKFDYELNLMNDLKKLGITDVFDINKANLSGIIADRSTVISDATHKANIEFSNEGIKAAAAVQMGGLGSAGCWFEYNYDVPVETIDLTFDNPYLFLIRDKESGEIWFTGTVYEPTSN